MCSEKIENAILSPLQATARLRLRNRLVMAPMTRAKATQGVLPDASIDYYRRRAEDGIGLIVSEGTWIDHPVASDRTAVPRFHGEDALAQWKRVLDAVHSHGAKMFPQLWHIGAIVDRSHAFHPEMAAMGPSGIAFQAGEQVDNVARPMTQTDIDAVIDAYGRAAADAWRLGFDGIELHGGHGFLIDQFFWSVTNRRDDGYNGSIRARTRFAVEVIRECKSRTAPDFPLSLRFSQWKIGDFNASLFTNEREMSEFLEPLVDAGVDIFSVSTRRHWLPAFEGSDLTLAGWTRKLSGKTVIAVGGIGVDEAVIAEERTEHDGAAIRESVLRAADRIERGEYDMIAVGRGVLADPEWLQKIRRLNWKEINPFRESIRHVMY
jgi:2,4-dienoyl-CoA reductase-like NADH-dependent reductase (Old Yellow Enzyme family)